MKTFSLPLMNAGEPAQVMTSGRVLLSWKLSFSGTPSQHISLPACPFFFFFMSAIRYFKTYFEVFVWILQSFYPVYSFPDFIVFGSPGLLHAIPKPKKMVLFTRRQGQPWCFSLVQLSVGKFVIPTHTHFAVSRISCTGFPLAETVDTVGVKQLTHCTAARAERKWWTNYL